MNTFVVALCLTGLIATIGIIVGIFIYLDSERQRYYRISLNERLRAQEGEDALAVKHHIEALYIQARDRIRRAS